MSAPGLDAGPVERATHVGEPRLALDELLAQLTDRAREVLAGRDRLRGLLAATQLVISGDLELPEVLRRIVTAACELIGARYGALGVLGADKQLEEFTLVGVSEEQIAAIGELPHGRGLLGALLREPAPLRLADIATDPRHCGFPPNHPPMTTFVGVPVRVRGELFGILYLTERLEGEFTVDDEQLLTALAATAGIAIDNARLLAAARQGQQWAHAAVQITREILSGPSGHPLPVVARVVCEVADADLTTIVLPVDNGSRARIEYAAGLDSENSLPGTEFPVQPSVSGQVISSGRPVLTADLGAETAVSPVIDSYHLGPAMLVPLVGSTRVLGALCIGRVRGRTTFTAADLELAVAFANHAALVLEVVPPRAAERPAEPRQSQDQSVELDSGGQVQQLGRH